MSENERDHGPLPVRTSPRALDLTYTKRTLARSSGPEHSVIPSLHLTLYADAPQPELGPQVADALRAFLDWIPEDELVSTIAGGDVSRLTRSRLTRDLARLEKPARDGRTTRLVYASSADGAPSDYGVHIELDPLRTSRGEDDTRANLIRFTFPWRDAEEDVEAVVERAMMLVSMLPVASGTLGFGFTYATFDVNARAYVDTLLTTHLGFEHSSPEARMHMRRRAPSPSFITFLGPGLAHALGGADRIGELCRGAWIAYAGTTLAIRAAERPPVGNLEVDPHDLGVLPTVARMLEPFSADDEPIAGTSLLFDAARWKARFRGAPVGAWRNRGRESATFSRPFAGRTASSE